MKSINKALILSLMAIPLAKAARVEIADIDNLQLIVDAIKANPAPDAIEVAISTLETKTEPISFERVDTGNATWYPKYVADKPVLLDDANLLEAVRQNVNDLLATRTAPEAPATEEAAASAASASAAASAVGPEATAPAEIPAEIIVTEEMAPAAPEVSTETQAYQAERVRNASYLRRLGTGDTTVEAVVNEVIDTFGKAGARQLLDLNDPDYGNIFTYLGNNQDLTNRLVTFAA